MLLNSNQNWKMHCGDCIEHMAEMPEHSVSFAVHSVPFPAVFSYTNEASDIGNSEDQQEYKWHFSAFFRHCLRVMQPGRVMMVHVQQIPRMKRAGEQGLNDFRGTIIRLATRAGWCYEYDWAVRKDPQAQAIRNKAWELKFQGFESDRARCRGALQDYLIKLSAPGENKVKINDKSDLTRNDWINYAEGTWSDIKESDTLNVREARGDDDVRHICPLQLEVIRRLILLYTNPGEIVFSPFAGIGSEGFMALGGKSPKTGKSIANPRRFYGIELKPEYHAAACKNLKRAEAMHNAAKQTDLFGDDQTEIVSHSEVDEAEVA